jgi:DNA-binding MarR family transcriptional regulator
MSEHTPSRRLASIDDLLLYRLNRLSAQAGAMVVRLCEGGFGITRREWRLLGLMQDGEELTSSALAQRVQLDRARTSRVTTSLIDKGLLAREVPQGNRREVRLRLTPAGLALRQALMPQVQTINQRILSVLNHDEMAQLDHLIQRLHVSAQTLSQALQEDLPKTQRRLGRAAKVAGVPKGKVPLR